MRTSNRICSGRTIRQGLREFEKLKNRLSGDHVKPEAGEAGGHAHRILFGDAHVDVAAAENLFKRRRVDRFAHVRGDKNEVRVFRAQLFEGPAQSRPEIALAIKRRIRWGAAPRRRLVRRFYQKGLSQGSAYHGGRHVCRFCLVARRGDDPLFLSTLIVAVVALITGFTGRKQARSKYGAKRPKK